MSPSTASMLFVEDYQHNREAVMASFQKRHLKDDVSAPASGDQFKELVSREPYTCALIDLTLTKWVGDDANNPIQFEGVNCYNGIDLAKCLLRIKPTMKIGLYSSFDVDLVNKLKSSGIYDQVEIVDTKGAPYNDVGKPLREFAKRRIETPVTIKPLHLPVRKLPGQVELFRCRRILNARGSGDHLWKAGKYAWLAGVNSGIPSYEKERKKLPPHWSLDNQEEHFAIKVNAGGILNGLVEEASQTALNFARVNELLLGDIPMHNEFTLSKPIFELFIARIFSNSFMKEEIALHDIPQISRSLSPFARLESQRILYKEMNMSMGLGMRSKEQLCDLLAPFNESGFPKIVDVFKGRVDKVDKGTAHIKLNSYSPEGAVRREEFGIDFMKENFLEESSEFEYTIYVSPEGSYCYLIEPL